MTHVVRPLRMEDANQIASLLDWAWFAPRSEQGWRWLCRTPRSREARSMPVGFVAEDGDGKVGGVFGLFAQDYVSRDGASVGGTGHTLIVHPRVKGASAALIDATLDQPELFAMSVLRGNALAAPIYERHGLRPCPEERGDLTLVWVTDPLAILAERAARAALSRRGPDAPRPPERFTPDRVFQTGLTRLGPNTAELFVEDIDTRIDTFWAALAAEGRMTARRDAAALRWRFADPDRTREPILLAWMDGAEIGGLLLAHVTKINEIEQPTLEVIDLVALRDCAAAALPELMTGLIRNASRLGAARVRLSVVTEENERLLGGLPGALRRRGHVHGHVRYSAGGEAIARDWRLTPYDGEHGFCHRHPPRPARDIRAA